MLSDYERQMCRDYKKRMDARQTPTGQIAMRLAEQKRKEAERREDILKNYTEPPTPPIKQEPEINPILKQYMNE
ncbi:hypothetical protein [Clostridium sp. M62/1]|uniref:hypothetical protein n=1 Tax=Clostridium sp. M62/1 TaxID=411486 RepID=UPI00356B5056